MFYECDDSNCNLSAQSCTNRAFEDLRQRCKTGGKYNIGVEVIKTIDRGYGVRSNRTFDANQIIVEYAGEIITQDECDSRMAKLYKDNEVSLTKGRASSHQELIQIQCYYLMSFDQNMIIDATRGSIARFVNHSCEPNCKMIKWTVAGKPRMALFAGDKGITTGDELTYDYNFEYEPLCPLPTTSKLTISLQPFLLQKHPSLPLWLCILPWRPRTQTHGEVETKGTQGSPGTSHNRHQHQEKN